MATFFTLPKAKIAGALGGLMAATMFQLATPAFADERTVCTMDMTAEDIAALHQKGVSASEAVPLMNCLQKGTLYYKKATGTSLFEGNSVGDAVKTLCLCDLKYPKRTDLNEKKQLFGLVR